jgi:hypothetical protein
MARCEDCIHGEICRFICYTRTVLVGGNAEKRCKYFKLAADFAPKSEVDKWKEINEQLHKEMSERMIEERKIERKLVAREIFGEIEYDFAEIRKIEYDNPPVGVMFNTLDYLKKKYTEEPSV